MPAGPGGVDEQRREAPHPPLHGHMVDDNPPIGEQLLDIPVGQAVPQIPAHRNAMTSGGNRKPANSERSRTGRDGARPSRQPARRWPRRVNATVPRRPSWHGPPLPAQQCPGVQQQRREQMPRTIRLWNTAGRQRRPRVDDETAQRDSSMARSTRDGVIGNSVTVAPKWASASFTAFATAAGDAMAPPSPMPL